MKKENSNERGKSSSRHSIKFIAIGVLIGVVLSVIIGVCGIQMDSRFADKKNTKAFKN